MGRRRPGHVHARLQQQPRPSLFIDPATLRSEYQSLRSFWPLQIPSVFRTTQPLVTTRSRAYTTGHMAGFLRDIRMGDDVLLLRRAGTRRERGSPTHPPEAGCGGAPGEGGPQSRGALSPQRPLPPPPPVERGPVGGPATDVGREAKGAGEGAAARSRPPKRRKKRGPSQRRPTVGNSLCDATQESVGSTDTRGRVEKV
jgi:hypothetical protein